MKPHIDSVIEKYQSNLYTVAFNICKNAQDAEDVVQDTFIQYWSQKKDFESEQHLRAWLFRVAINQAKNKVNTFFQENDCSSGGLYGNPDLRNEGVLRAV